MSAPPAPAAAPTVTSAATPDASLRPAPELPITWVASDRELAAAVERWAEHDVLALDTEFVRERTYYSQLGLVQVADDARVWLLDPLAWRGREARLGAALAARPRQWVVHSASEDLEVLGRVLSFVPGDLFDTQVAAALAGCGPSLSLQRLAALELGWELPKGETRTNWLARPLTPAQLTYAAEDVVALLPLADRLRERLAAQSRLDWLREETARSIAEATTPLAPGDAGERVKGAGRFNPRQLSALGRLAAWREEEARRRDLPRGFVLRDETLVALAARLPTGPRELARLPGTDPRRTARDGATWLALIAAARTASPGELPPRRPHLPPSSREVEAGLKELVRQRAAELGVAPEVLASRRLLAAILEQAYFRTEPTLPAELAGWRRQVIGEELLRAAVDAVARERAAR